MKAYSRFARDNPGISPTIHTIVRLYAELRTDLSVLGGLSNAAGEVIFVLDFCQPEILPWVGPFKAQF